MTLERELVEFAYKQRLPLSLVNTFLHSNRARFAWLLFAQRGWCFALLIKRCCLSERGDILPRHFFERILCPYCRILFLTVLERKLKTSTFKKYHDIHYRAILAGMLTRAWIPATLWWVTFFFFFAAESWLEVPFSTFRFYTYTCMACFYICSYVTTHIPGRGLTNLSHSAGFGPQFWSLNHFVWLVLGKI